MTALCGGGTSSPKPWLESLTYLTTAAIASRLNNLGGAWATVAAPLIGLISLNLPQFCATDPPPDVEITAAEYDALIKLEFGDTLTSAVAKLKDKVLIALWHELCECDGIATPPLPPAVFLPPAGVSVPGNAADQACSHGLYGADPGFWSGSGAEPPGVRIQNLLFPDLPHVQTPGTPPTVPAGVVVDIGGWQSYRVRGAARARTNTSLVAYPVYLHFLDPAGAIVGSDNMIPQWSPTLDFPEERTGDVPAGARLLSVLAYRSTATANGELQLDFQAYCGDQTTAPSQACCPPDASLMALLDQVLKQVTLLQRYKAPFAVVPGAVHSGLTGEGEFPVPRIIGLRLEVTSQPPPRVLEGNPDYWWNQGWVSVGGSSGMLQEQRVARPDHIWLPDNAQAVTRFRWSLRPGVVLRATELYAEP